MIHSRRKVLRLAMLGSATAIGMNNGLVLQSAKADSQADNSCNALLSHEFRPLMGPERHPLCDEFANKVLLVVNTASKCGFTPQFEDLEKLYSKYSPEGFAVLGFPSGDFRQELDSEEAVAEFCELNYGVSFPMFEKTHVTGDSANPFFRDLAEATGSFPRWNFNKYLIDRNGRAVGYYGSSAQPLGSQMVSDIEALL